MRTNVTRWFTMVAPLLILGMGNAVAQQQQAALPKFKLMISAFSDGGVIPNQYSCVDSKASSPALRWSDPPTGAASFAMIMHDTDGAPTKGTMDYTDWIFWNIPESSTSVAANVKPDSSPDGIAQGKNVRNENGFHAPCPPPGAPAHHYIFELYALDTKLGLPAGSARGDLLKAMEGHVIGKATYVGLFGQ